MAQHKETVWGKALGENPSLLPLLIRHLFTKTASFFILRLQLAVAA
jgi:hypothetical protein